MYHPKSFILKLKCFCNSRSTLNKFFLQLEKPFLHLTRPFCLPPSVFHLPHSSFVMRLAGGGTIKFATVISHVSAFCLLPSTFLERTPGSRNTKYLTFILRFSIIAFRLPHSTADSGVWKTNILP